MSAKTIKTAQNSTLVKKVLYFRKKTVFVEVWLLTPKYKSAYCARIFPQEVKRNLLKFWKKTEITFWEHCFSWKCSWWNLQCSFDNLVDNFLQSSSSNFFTWCRNSKKQIQRKVNFPLIVPVDTYNACPDNPSKKDLRQLRKKSAKIRKETLKKSFLQINISLRNFRRTK